MFGSNSGSGFSFGSKPVSSGASTSTAGPFSLGTNNNTSGLNNNNTGNGLSFGANNASTSSNTGANPIGGFSFGSASNQVGSNTGGLFGSSNNNSTTIAPAAGGLFGNANTTTNTNTNSNSATGGLFGGSQSQTQPQQSQQSQQQQNTFNSQPSFPWSQNSNQSSQQQQQQPLSFSSSSSQNAANTANTAYSQNIQEQLQKIKNSWDPTSQNTSLKTYFYNSVAENQVALYSKPEHEGEEWENAYAERPSNTSIPVSAIGFDDLQRRSQTQINHVAQARVILQQISDKNKILSDKHDLDTASRIIAAKSRHSRISRRLLRLASTLAVLKSKGYQLSPSEENLIQTFQELLDKTEDPSGLGKSNELWARLAVLKEKAKSLSEQLDNTLGIKNTEISNVDDINDTEQTQDQILKIAQVLQQQQTGIKNLDKILKDDEEIVQKYLK